MVYSTYKKKKEEREEERRNKLWSILELRLSRVWLFRVNYINLLGRSGGGFIPHVHLN